MDERRLFASAFALFTCSLASATSELALSIRLRASALTSPSLPAARVASESACRAIDSARWFATWVSCADAESAEVASALRLLSLDSASARKTLRVASAAI